ncbi:hypothetical protein EDC96DRAFT_426438, partial [Choanephora cucurbitarum]
LEQEIALLQQEVTESLALKAGQRWREKGETSVRYLKSMVQQRQATERISAFRNDTTDEPCADKETMLHSAHQFYQQLYTDDSVDANGLDDYLSDIASLPSVRDEDHESLLAPITIDGII